MHVWMLQSACWASKVTSDIELPAYLPRSGMESVGCVVLYIFSSALGDDRSQKKMVCCICVSVLPLSPQQQMVPYVHQGFTHSFHFYQSLNGKGVRSDSERIN